MTRGQIVRSLKGRDKGDFQVVLSCEGAFVTLCDGKRRSLEKPKKKKTFHVAATNSAVGEERLKTNRQIREALRVYQGDAETGGF
ncbi:MAG: KOW domain-containing RNA-binding protein [Oscillospiraceae bacterium]